MLLIDGLMSSLVLPRLTKIFTLSQVLGEWVVEPKAVTFSHDSLANPLSSFVVDYQTGTDVTASPDGLIGVMRSAAEGRSKGSPADRAAEANHCIWIACAAKSVRAQLDFSGERIAKLEMVEDEFKDIQIVDKYGESFFVLGGCADV
jgi:hypothetical protein